jgi:protein-disulfide isomerase
MLRKKFNLGLLLLSFILLLPFSAFADSASDLFRNGNDPINGNPNGSVTLVEFFDYQCSHCANMVSVVDRLISNNPSLRVVYKDYPVLGSGSVYAARAALAAKKQGSYLQLHRVLFASDGSTSSVIASAKRLGLDVSRLESDMNSSAVTNQLRDNQRLAQKLGIPGTPAFYVGKTNSSSMSNVRSFMGEVSQSELQRAIDGSN